MKNEWKRGYGQRYKHLVIREEKTANGNCTRTFLHADRVLTGHLKISLTGIVTFKSVQYVSGFIMNNKRKEARKMFVIELLGKAMIIAIISIFGIGSVLLSLENKEF